MNRLRSQHGIAATNGPGCLRSRPETRRRRRVALPRPRVLRSCCVAGAALLTGFVLGSGGPVGQTGTDALERFEYSEPQMGVPFRIVLYAPGRAAADAAARAAFDRISALNELLSDYEFDSELCRLSRTAGSGEDVPVSEELWTVLRRAQEMARRSDGAFDVTVGPLISLWRKARRERKLPDPARLEAARAATGWRHLVLNPERRTARLTTPRMRLDLGGIAKGYAADEALRVLRSHGIASALVSGAGDLVVGDPPPGKAGWRIEVPPLEAPHTPPSCYVLLRNIGLATSGDAFQFVEIGGVRYSHIVDPRTGLGLTDHSLVTVIARDAMTADSLSTALSVAEPHRAEALAREDEAGFRLMRQPEAEVEVRENAAFRRWLDP